MCAYIHVREYTLTNRMDNCVGYTYYCDEHALLTVIVNGYNNIILCNGHLFLELPEVVGDGVAHLPIKRFRYERGGGSH